MTFRYSNRVKVTASAPGTAAFPATAAATGFIGFNNIPSIANGDVVPYTAWDGGTNWETGWATYNSTGPVLTRTTIVQNSAGTFVAINFSSGIVTIFCDATAATLPLIDSGGSLALPGLLDLSAAAAGQIKFPATQNPSANANTLDDYEEGTWTPFDTNAAFTYTSNASYTKVGRLVAFQLFCGFPAMASATQIPIGGFPFPNASTATSETGYNGMETMGFKLNWYFGPGVSYILGYDWSGNAVQYLSCQNQNLRLTGVYHV